MAAVAAAIVVAVAALVVGIISLVHPLSSAHPSAPVAAPTSSTQTPAQNTTDADRALCTAIAPLMAESDRSANAWRATGDPGTPARDAALPKYRSDTEDWAGRIQGVLNAHADANAFFQRTLQRFIDDQILLVRNMAPGPAQPSDNEAWQDSLTAYGGPMSVCSALAVKWW